MDAERDLRLNQKASVFVIKQTGQTSRTYPSRSEAALPGQRDGRRRDLVVPVAAGNGHSVAADARASPRESCGVDVAANIDELGELARDLAVVGRGAARRAAKVLAEADEVTKPLGEQAAQRRKSKFQTRCGNLRNKTYTTCASVSQDWVRMTFLTYSATTARCCWMTVTEVTWQVTTCSTTKTLRTPQKLLAP